MNDNHKGDGSDQTEDEVDAALQANFRNIAEARYVLRRVLRIADDQAKQAGLDPLAHQLLLQVYGLNEGKGTAISAVASRLDIPPALGSRLVRQLEERGFIQRSESKVDKRVTSIVITKAGTQMLDQINQSVRQHLSYMKYALDDDQRRSALSIFSLYVGLTDDPQPLEALLNSGRDGAAGKKLKSKK